LTRSAVLLLAAAALLLPPQPAPGQAAPLTIRLADSGPAVAIGPVLQEAALEDALRSGLPLRLRLRVELWRQRLFDELVDHATFNQVLLFEPLDNQFLVGAAQADAPHAHGSYAAARAAIETVYQPRIRPHNRGRYYYLASLEIETLSLSDLDELGQWLRGEVAPAVRGRRSLPGAIGTGLRRLFIRVLDLPARRYQARSELFVIP
jgi:hypothetical protein